MSSTCISVLMDTCGLGLAHPVKGPEVVVKGLSGTQNASVQCLIILSWQMTTDKRMRSGEHGGCTSMCVGGHTTLKHS